MTLAPYFVLWAFAGGAVVLLVLGAVWLFEPRWVGGLFRRLWAGDLAAAWLAAAQAHYFGTGFLGGDPRALGDPRAWLGMGAGLAAWLVLRLVPNPLRRPAPLLALALALWALALGAGYAFIGAMERDAARLRAAPAEVLAPAVRNGVPGLPLALVRATRFRRLDAETRDLLAEVRAQLGRGQPLDPGLRAAALDSLVPALLEHYTRDLNRLRAYQWLQMGLLALLLLVWGFGERHAPQ